MTSNQAFFIKNRKGFSGEARLYKLMPALTMVGHEGTVITYDFVIVSATTAPFTGPETYIFPATEDGFVIDWGELPGSYRGGLSHEFALQSAGYEIVKPALPATGTPERK